MSEVRATVAIVSPHRVVRRGFTAMLGEPHCRVEIIDLPESFDHDEPDVVLYDVVALADGDGTDLDYLVKRTGCAILAVGRDLRPDLLAQALTRGADGFISMAVAEEELLTAIDSAMTGWEPGDPGPNPVVGSSISEQRLHLLGGDAGLSTREARVLALIAQGLSNDEIAARDFLSINTVKTYIRTAYRKIGVRNRSQAVVWTLQHGFGTDLDASVYRPDEPSD